MNRPAAAGGWQVVTAVGLVALATALRAALDPYLGDAQLFGLYYLTLLLLLWRDFGRTALLTALFLGAVCSSVFFLAPRGVFRGEHVEWGIGLGVYLVTGLGGIRLAEVLRAQWRRSEALAADYLADLTALKQAELALRRGEERFRSLANSTPSIIWTADSSGHITFHNQRWLEYTGISPGDNVADWPRLVLHPDDHERCVEAWTRALQTGSEYEIEVRNRRHDGEYRWFLTRATPVRDADGRIVEWYGSTTDIHDAKCAAEALRDADRRKDEFLATLAHELRNPLAPVRNYLALLRQAPRKAEVMEQALSTMERQIGQMVRLIDDLLDVSRITRNKLELRRERVSLASVVQAAVETCRSRCERVGHELTVSLPAEPVFLHADPVRLAQILGNLLTNAIKYTPPGGRIELTAERASREVVLTVRDTGIGIARDMLPRVFDLFTQVDRALDRAEGGLGIGLSLVKRLVEMHGGQVTAYSDGPDHGSAFVVTLPILMAEPIPRG